MRLNPIQATPTATLANIPSGQAGVAATLNAMVRLVKEYRRNPEIRRFAENLVRPVREKDYVGEIRALFEYVRDRIRYTQDIRDVETLKSPDAVIIDGMGDCDDKSTLLATLLETMGYRTRFLAIGTVEPGVFDHVYTEVHLGAGWIPLESTEQWVMGQRAPAAFAPMIRHV